MGPGRMYTGTWPARTAISQAASPRMRINAGGAIRLKRLFKLASPRQDARLGDERPRDRHAHAHAAGELARVGVAEARETNLLHRAFDPRSSHGARHAAHSQGQVNIV